MGLGPELVVNGDFSSAGTGWTVVGAAWDFGESYAAFSDAGGNESFLIQYTVFPVGTYEVTFTTSSEGLPLPAVNCFFRITSSGETPSKMITITGFQTYTERLTITESGTNFLFNVDGTNGVNQGIGIDDVSIRKVFGGGVNMALIDALNGED